MASFIKANRKRQMDDWKMMAQVGYSGGIIGSMSLEKRRPSFAEVFNFPQDTIEVEKEVEKNEAQLIVWAENMNRAYRKAQKKDKDGR